MICRAAAAFLLLLLSAVSAGAQEFNLPGLGSDSDAYSNQLTAKNPAGGTPQARAKAEQAASAAIAKNDWNAAAAALETRISLGDAKPEQWLALARADLRRTPPDLPHALATAWQAYQAVDTGPAQIPALLVIADALKAQNRPAQQIQALEAAVQRAPNDALYKQMLADARKAAGMLVARVRTEAEADPPRACIAFTNAPARRADFHAEDWVRIEPPIADAAVTREGDQICVSGLPLAATTRVVLRGGMPGEDNVNLLRDTPVAIAMGNRAPLLSFDNRLFLLPRGQAPRITLTSVNFSAVKIKLVRVSERAMLPWTKENQLGSAIEVYAASQIEETGKTVWEGRADIPKFAMNTLQRTALPLPDAFQEPGLYALLVKPGDGQSPDSSSAAQMILRTDLAPTVWRGTDGLTIQVRGYSDAKPRAGVKLDLLARDNDILASATTDQDGVARFAAPLLAGSGPVAPASIHGMLDGDLVALDLNAAAFDLSDRGVEGMPHPGPLDAFVYTDRGVYRPGETVQVMALLRDAAGQPADIPARIRVKRPNGEVFTESVPSRTGDAAENLPVTLSFGAAIGTWSIEVLADPDRPPIGRGEFRVDNFVPDRMGVALGPDQGPIVPGKDYNLPVTARFLYGAPAANLTGKATLHLEINPEPPAALAGYKIGLAGEEYAPENRDISIPATDADGKTSVPIRIARAPDTTHPVRATIDVGIDDPSGHAAHAHATIPLRPAGNLIGVKPGFDGSVDANTEAGFDVAAVDPDGKRIPLKAKLRLVRERPDWRFVFHGQLARFEIVWRDEPLETRDVTIPADGTLHYGKTLGFGRYRLELSEAGGGLAATSVRFRSGWVASDSPDVPDKVDVSADRKSYAPDGTARVHIAPPFAGEATVAVLTDRVHSLRTISVPAGGSDIDVKIDPAWGPGAYVAVHVFRGGTDTTRPSRAIGLTWLGIDPAARTLAVAINAPDQVRPRIRSVIPVKTAPGAWVTVAAVDEGILRLTDFVSPDPAAHFLGRRGLGLDIRDDWGRLILPAQGEATALRQGGDEGVGGIHEIPQKIVSLFQKPVQAGADGVANIPFDFPDFNGQVRLMVVAWQGNRIGSASKDMLVRDPLVAEPLLPRFLAPGDTTRLAVLMQNVELPAGEAAVKISLDGPLALDGPDRLAANLAPNGQSVQFTGLKGTGAGRGVIHLDVTGPSGFHIQRETAITVRPARGRTADIASADLGPAIETRITPPIDRFIAGTWRAEASFGGAVRYDAAAIAQALDDYPLFCLEQSASKGFALSMEQRPLAGPDRDARLQFAIASVLDKQRYDGGFALWSANGDAEVWLSSYTLEFLLRAKASGATVPDAALKDALKYEQDGLDTSLDSPDHLAEQAYRIYVLALAGRPPAGAARVLYERLNRLPTPLARAQLGAALARANDRPRAEAAFNAALAAPARKPWGTDYGTAMRDQAAIAVLLKESGLFADRIPTLISQMPGSDLKPDALNTQEDAWLIAAASALGRGVPPASVTFNGNPLPAAPVISIALTAPATAKNTGQKAIFQTVSTMGVPVVAPGASRAQMRVSRLFYNLDGSPLNLDQLKQNTVFVLLLQGQSDDGQDHRAMLLQGLPAGWEIAGRFGSGAVPGMSWLGELSETEAQPGADDRFAAVMALTGDKPSFRIAVQLRAVTPGNYEIPGAELSDMYRPGVYARQAANRITVLPAQ